MKLNMLCYSWRLDSSPFILLTEVQAVAIAEALSNALGMSLSVEDLGITVYQ